MTYKEAKSSSGHGHFFAVDRRVWAKVCDISLNTAIAYLVLARGTLGDMRTTSWSAKAIEERTAIPWRKAKMAVQALVSGGLVRQDKGGQHPRYYVLPAFEVPGCVPGAKATPLSRDEAKLIERLGKGPMWVPKVGRWDGACWAQVSAKPFNLAQALVKRGVLVQTGDQTFAMANVPVDETPDWIWLPVAIVDGAADEVAPIELIRQSANLAALRLFIDLYHAQSLNDQGGVHWRQLRREYERQKVGERGFYVVWGFRAGSQTGWLSAPFIAPHRTGEVERTANRDGSWTETDTGWKVFWSALGILTSTGLVEMVGHIIDADTNEGAVLHPYAMGNGELAEQAVASAAHKAGLAMLDDRRRESTIDANLWLCPIRKHITDVQLVGLARLRYKARTTMTAAWLAESMEWVEWVQKYKAAEVEANPKPC